MKTQSTRLLFALVALTALALLGGCQPAATPAPAPTAPPAGAPAAEPTEAPLPVAEAPEVKIVFIGPLTGPDGVDGQGAAKAAELAVKMKNAADGVCGAQIQFEAYDTKADPKEGVNIATLVCSDPTVMAAVADYNSSVALAEAPVFNECGLSQINYYAAAPDIPAIGGEYTFRVYPPGQNMSLFLADWMITKLGYTKIAAIYENTDYGKGLYDAFVIEAENLGAEIVVSEAVLKDQTDLSAVISKVKDASPDAVIGLIQYQVGAYWAIQADQLGVDLPFYGSDGIFAPEIINLAGASIEGARTMAAYTITSTDPVVMAFVEAYRAEYGEDPNNPGGYAFDAFTFVMEALEATGCEGREAVKDWFTTQMVDKKGVTGTITLFERERGFAPGMYTPIEVRDGKWQEVVE